MDHPETRAAPCARRITERNGEMIRNLKALGLGLIAAFAMSAVVASAAHATEADFRCGTNPEKECTIKVTHDPGTPLGVFKTHAGNVSCEDFHAIGFVQDGIPTSELTLTELQYTECELGGLFAQVKIPAGCHYTLHSGETVEAGVATGKVDVAQTAGTTCKIEIVAGTCTVTVEPQENLSSIKYTNKEEEVTKGVKKETITAHANVEKIKYTTGPPCPGGAGTFADGKYEETLTATGLNKNNESEHTDLTLVDTP